MVIGVALVIIVIALKLIFNLKPKPGVKIMHGSSNRSLNFNFCLRFAGFKSRKEWAISQGINPDLLSLFESGKAESSTISAKIDSFVEEWLPKVKDFILNQRTNPIHRHYNTTFADMDPLQPARTLKISGDGMRLSIGEERSSFKDGIFQTTEQLDRIINVPFQKVEHETR